MHNSVMDVHARIQTFLQQRSVVALPYSAPLPDGHYTKAGVIPFIRADPTLYYMMKPVAKRPGLGAPDFQIGKGTRMEFVGGEWVDMREAGVIGDERETLVMSALREGIEELGLKLDTIKTLYDAGPYQFASSNTGAPKYMWLFAAEMTSRDMLADAEIEPSTAERGWLTLADFMIAGREDHRYILTDIASKLETHAPR